MVNTFFYTDKGPRNGNEDSLKIGDGGDFLFACIADGVGGARCGKFASETAVNCFSEDLISFELNLENEIRKIHEKIKEIQKERNECNGMATTFTACAVKNSILKGVHVGDSRLCILRGKGIKQLTDSHTEANRLIKAGKLKVEDIDTYPRKHILESAIGINGDLAIHNFSFNLASGDRILLTTDGVHEVISKIEFRDLSKKYSVLNDFGNSIVALLKMKKLRDNVTFIILQIP